MQRNELRFDITVLQLNSMQATATCSRTSGDLYLPKQLSNSSKTAIAFPETAQLNRSGRNPRPLRFTFQSYFDRLADRVGCLDQGVELDR